MSLYNPEVQKTQEMHRRDTSRKTINESFIKMKKEEHNSSLFPPTQPLLLGSVIFCVGVPGRDHKVQHQFMQFELSLIIQHM